MATTVSLLPADIDLEIEQGADSTIEFQLKRYENSTWINEDITNDTVEFTARDDFGGTTTIITKLNEAGEHAYPAEGRTRFKLTKAETISDAGSNVIWRYEVRRVVNGTGDEIVYMKGKLTLAKTVGAIWRFPYTPAGAVAVGGTATTSLTTV